MDIRGERLRRKKGRMKDTERGIKTDESDKGEMERDEQSPLMAPSPLAEYSKQGAQQKVFFPEGHKTDLLGSQEDSLPSLTQRHP